MSRLKTIFGDTVQVAVLEALLEDRKKQNLTCIAKKTGWSASNISRAITPLKTAGYVREDNDHPPYREFELDRENIAIKGLIQFYESLPQEV